MDTLLEELEWEKDYDENYPYEVRLIDIKQETIIDTWRYSFKQNAIKMLNTLKKKHKNNKNLQVKLEVIGV